MLVVYIVLGFLATCYVSWFAAILSPFIRVGFQLLKGDVTRFMLLKMKYDEVEAMAISNLGLTSEQYASYWKQIKHKPWMMPYDAYELASKHK